MICKNHLCLIGGGLGIVDPTLRLFIRWVQVVTGQANQLQWALRSRPSISPALRIPFRAARHVGNPRWEAADPVPWGRLWLCTKVSDNGGKQNQKIVGTSMKIWKSAWRKSVALNPKPGRWCCWDVDGIPDHIDSAFAGPSPYLFGRYVYRASVGAPKSHGGWGQAISVTANVCM